MAVQQSPFKYDDIDHNIIHRANISLNWIKIRDLCFGSHSYNELILVVCVSFDDDDFFFFMNSE